MYRGGRRARFRALVAMTALVATGLVAAPRPASADLRLRFFDFNMCGAACNGGGFAVVDDIRARILQFKPHVAVFNEACQAQVEGLDGQLRRSAWPMLHVFHDQRQDDRCPAVNGQRLFGDAVFTSGRLGFKEVHPLPNRGGGGAEHRAVLCVNTHLPVEVHACAVHLVANDPVYNQRQLAATASILNRRATQGPVVLAGDFNQEPDRLDVLNDPRRGGQFVDLVAGKRTRNGQKIDHIFVSRGRFSNFSGGVKGSRYSDHRTIFGHADVR